MNRENGNKTVHCKECNPPSKYDIDSDYWKCTKCGTSFRLDTGLSTWWPEEWWSIKEQKEKEIQERRGE